ncbi:MAG: WYL domain-containing protein [Arcobacteraceae bacterium]|jgi:predicted DNA-binding transcriptional regulator YafY|nr:WYL domain-containing protein [Arcobacteraceae bacterium]
MKKEHDTIATRLAIILTKLNSGEKLSIVELVEEFGVTARTIQRDINQRLSYLPIKKEDNLYYLEEYYLGKLTFDDIKNFALLSGIQHLYPTLNNDFLKNVLDSKVNQVYLIKGHNYENLTSKIDEFELLESSILNTKQVTLTYNDKARLVNPYKLVNQKGIWYLIATEDNLLKTFSLSKILNLQTTNNLYSLDDAISQIIASDDNIWYTDRQIEVVLSISSTVAEYFLRRKILPNQTFLSQSDTELVVSTRVSFDEEILKIVRYWIPHIKIISPLYLQEELENSLKNYLHLS